MYRHQLYWCLIVILSFLSQLAMAQDKVDFYKPVDAPERSANGVVFSRFVAGERIKEVPQQSPIEEYVWHKKGSYELGYTDTFSIKGLLISKRRYLGDERADIAPLDMVLGWQKMSDPAILKEIAVRQNNRFYYWRVNQFPLSRQELELMSTNVHLIPDSPAVMSQLMQMERGQAVALDGYLVDVKAEDGFIWATSRVRNDTGDGACEIMLVKQVRVLE